MKQHLIFLACWMTAALAYHPANAQVTDPKQTATQGATDHVNNNVSNGVDNGLNKTEGAIKGLFKKKPKTAKTDSAKTAATSPTGSTPATGSTTGSAATTGSTAPAAGSTATPVTGSTPGSATQDPAPPPSLRAYSNYDFVPGDQVIFEDDFTGDADGEFPTHWSLSKGQAVINKVTGTPAFCLTEGNYASVAPRMRTPNNYLPDNFTVEFDFYPSDGSYNPVLLFSTANDESRNIDFGTAVGLGYFPNDISGTYPGDKENFINKWHHAAMIKKGNQIKCYEDQYRVLVLPDCGDCKVIKLEVGGIGDSEHPIVFKNFRIAAGGSMNMIGKKFTEAKIVTHGINFDVDKATIKPESMGTLNMIILVLKDNPDLKFEVDGHTDNSGAAPHNLQLSQQRADAVRTQLITMGVDASRLSTKGFGDTKPVADNNSPEGKANNRRVEFVKM